MKIENNNGYGVTFTASSSVLVTPSATEINAGGLYVEVGGTLELEFADGSVDTWNVPNNFIVPANIKRFTAG